MLAIKILGHFQSKINMPTAKKNTRKAQPLRKAKSVLQVIHAIQANAPFTRTDAESTLLMGYEQAFAYLADERNHVMENLERWAEKIRNVHEQDCACDACLWLRKQKSSERVHKRASSV